jgi:hypothetical protein
MSLVEVDNPLHNVLVVGSCGTLLVLCLIQILLCLRKPKAGENDRMLFIMSLRITFIGSTKFLFFLVATGRRLQPPRFQSTT